jgi:hypothetical protein
MTESETGRVQFNKEGKLGRDSRIHNTMDRPDIRNTMDTPSHLPESGFTSTAGMDKTPEATAGHIERGDVEAILGADAYAVSEVDGRIIAKAGDKSVDVTDYFGTEQVLDRFQPQNPDDRGGPLMHTETVKIVGTQRRQTGPAKGELLVLATRLGASGQVSIRLDQIGRRDPENGRTWRLPQTEE